ncbi:hypothetical protein K438DRAFT_1789558 [Mycena galopus ATCC 62051]|nr:hypothetical protein K438DRAFT_1789558 [Mycena galopus ATCC 62051]
MALALGRIVYFAVAHSGKIIGVLKVHSRLMRRTRSRIERGALRNCINCETAVTYNAGADRLPGPYGWSQALGRITGLAVADSREIIGVRTDHAGDKEIARELYEENSKIHDRRGPDPESNGAPAASSWQSQKMQRQTIFAGCVLYQYQSSTSRLTRHVPYDSELDSEDARTYWTWVETNHSRKTNGANVHMPELEVQKTKRLEFEKKGGEKETRSDRIHHGICPAMGATAIRDGNEIAGSDHSWTIPSCTVCVLFANWHRVLCSQLFAIRNVQHLVTRAVAYSWPARIVYPALAAPPGWDRKNPCLNFYRTKIDLDFFSCDWENYIAEHFFAVSSYWHDLSEMDFFLRRIFKIPGPIRPLAFLDYYEPCILFEASGEYCYLDTGSNDYLIHYGHAFASPDEFLAAFTHPDSPLEGTVYKFPEDTEERYAVVYEEQVRRKEAARKAGQN